MQTIILIAFYLVTAVKLWQIHRQFGLKILVDGSYTYQSLVSLFLALNINIVFAGSLTGCSHEVVPYVVLSVLVGTFIYLQHLISETIEGKSMPVFFGLVYFGFLFDMAYSVYSHGIHSLDVNESKMCTVLLFPFFKVVDDLVGRERKKRNNKGPGE